MAQAGGVEGTKVNNMAWLLSEHAPTPDSMGRIGSNALATGTATHCGGSAAELPTASGDSALHVDFDQAATQDGDPSR